MAKSSLLKVNEIFGPTIQGEGPFVGQKIMFVRFFGCDFNCSFCDTKYARIGSAFKEMKSKEIIKTLKNLSSLKSVVITGGNPCIQNLTDFVLDLKEEGYFIAVETQGTLFPNWLDLVDFISFSPKPPSSGNPVNLEKFFENASNLKVPFVLKVVIANDEDYNWIKSFKDKYLGKYPLYLQVCTNPNDTPENILKNFRKLSQKVIQDNELNGRVFVLPQLHVLGGLK